MRAGSHQCLAVVSQLDDLGNCLAISRDERDGSCHSYESVAVSSHSRSERNQCAADYAYTIHRIHPAIVEEQSSKRTFQTCGRPHRKLCSDMDERRQRHRIHHPARERGSIQGDESMTKTMQEWKNAGVGVGGLLATITLKSWNEFAAACAATLTTLYMGWKCWKDIIKPWLKRVRK